MPGQIWETAGKVRMIPKGTYNPNREYEPLDMVSDENNLKYYIAKSKVSPGIDLSDREYWHVIADVSQLRGPAGGNYSINIEQINNTNDYKIDFVESGNTIVNSIAGKTGTVALNAGDVEYDNTGTYASGTIGAGIAELNKISDISYNLWEKESSYTFTRYIEVTGLSIPAGTYTMSAIVESNDIDKNVCRILFRNSSMNEICHYFFDRGARCDRLIELNENCSSIIFYASETANYSTGDTATWSNIMLVSGDRIMPYSGHTTAHDATSRLILKNYFEGTLNVKDFGARGDGVTDDTAAFKAMFSENAKTYYIPSGSYIVQPFICGTDKTNGKQITQNIKICGDGAGLTRLQLKNYSIPAEGPLSENGCMMFLMEGPSGQGDKVTIEISDLYIDMNRRHNNYDSTFDPNEFDEWYLQHCHAICIRSHAVSSVNVIVKNVEFYDLIADGICFNGNSASNSFDGILVDGVISKGRTAPRSDVCITGDFNSAIVTNCSLDDFEIEVNYFTQANTHYFEMSNCTIRRKIDLTSKWNPSLPETVIRNSSKYLVNNCNIFGKVNFSSLHVMFTSCHFSISESVYVQNADAQFLDCEIEDDKTLVADWDSPGLFYCIEDTKGNKFKFSGCQIRCRHYRNFLCTKNAITDNNTNINDITIENCHIVVSLIHDSSYGGNFIRVGNMNVYAIGNRIDLTGDANSSFILIGYPYKTSRTIVIKNNVLLKNSVLFKSSANMGDDGIVITVKAKGNVPYNSDYNIFRWMFDEITSTRGGTGSTYNIIEANDYESDSLPSNGMWVRGQKIYNTRPETNNILAWCCTQNGYANSTPTAVFEPIYMGSKFDELKSEIGELSNLDTTAKTNLVAAINEAAQSGPASGNFTVTETLISGENYELELDNNGEDLAGEIAELKTQIEELPDVADTVESGADLYICDANGNVIGMFANGHIKTKYFNSADLATSGILYRNRDTIDGVYAACRWHQPTSSDKQFCMLISGDIHTDPTRMLSVIEYLNAIDAFDAGVMLGDMSGDTFNSPITHYTDAIVNAQKPFLTVLGNHDVVGATSEYALYTKYGGMLQYAELASGESVSEKCYYYKDFVAQKIRVIVLMQYDLVGRASDTGDICFGQDQINWFIGVLGSTPSDYGVIIAEHTNPSRYMTYNMDEKYTSSTWYQSNYASTVMNGNPIPDIVNAWINGTTFSQTYSYTFDNPPSPLSVSADFTARGTGEFITYIGGHWHMDVLGTPTGYTDQPDYHVPAAGLSAATQGDIPRKAGTVSEDSFCVMAVDRNKKTVKIFHIGAHYTKDAVDRQYFKYNYGGANA